MNNFYNFENLECWQQAKELAKDMYQLASEGNLKHDFVLRDQLRKASISIMSYIATGKERGSMSDFVRYLKMAKGSAAALRSHLVVSRDVGYLGEGDFLDLQDRANKISALIGGLINALNKNRKEGDNGPERPKDTVPL